jgi:hypothetical protein
VVNAVCPQVVKDHAMSKVPKRKGPHELADLILKHDPNASLETIANIISDWGDLSDDQKFGGHVSTDIEAATANGRRRSGNMNIE